MTREEAVEWMLFQKEQVIAMSDDKPGTLTVAYDMAIEALKAEPVKHGEWKCMADCGVTECDQCGWSIEEYVGDYNFCPNCGAKMDGDMR